jgi:predicted transport protein
MKYVPLETVSIKRHPEINELWIQQVIAEDPKILGLGDVVLRDKERSQPRGGRLDLLLQDPDTNKRYEVEVQLGATDESHIIRTIEYWDIERRRYPQYDHCAVLVAENITSRFLNIVSLFNGMIPLIAIQMTAVKVEGGLSLIFTKVIDELAYGLVDEDEDIHEVTDRDYWLKRGAKKTVQLADSILEIIKTFDSSLDFKYNKFYIGLARDGVPNNFVACKPKKQWLNLEVRLREDKELSSRLEDSGLDAEYLSKWGKYRLRIKPGEINQHKEVLTELMKSAYKENES